MSGGEGGPQLKEPHRGSRHKKTARFIWYFEGAGRDENFLANQSYA